MPAICTQSDLLIPATVRWCNTAVGQVIVNSRIRPGASHPYYRCVLERKDTQRWWTRYNIALPICQVTPALQECESCSAVVVPLSKSVKLYHCCEEHAFSWQDRIVDRDLIPFFWKAVVPTEWDLHLPWPMIILSTIIQRCSLRSPGKTS